MKIHLNDIIKSIEFRKSIKSLPFEGIGVTLKGKKYYSLDTINDAESHPYHLNTWDFARWLPFAKGEGGQYKWIYKTPKNVKFFRYEDIQRDFYFRCRVVAAGANIEIIGEDVDSMEFGEYFLDYITYGGMTIFSWVEQGFHLECGAWKNAVDKANETYKPIAGSHIGRLENTDV